MKFKESSHKCPDSRAHMSAEEAIENNVKDHFNSLKRLSYSHYILDSVFDDYTCDKIIVTPLAFIAKALVSALK